MRRPQRCDLPEKDEVRILLGEEGAIGGGTRISFEKNVLHIVRRCTDTRRGFRPGGARCL